MARNRSKRRSLRAARRPARKGRNRLSAPSIERRAIQFTNLMSLRAVNGQSAQFDLSFDRQVVAKALTAPPVGDFVMSSGGQTSRHAILWVQRTPNVVRATMDGIPAASHTFTGTIAVNCGSIAVTTGKFGDRTADIVL